MRKSIFLAILLAQFTIVSAQIHLPILTNAQDSALISQIGVNVSPKDIGGPLKNPLLALHGKLPSLDGSQSDTNEILKYRCEWYDHSSYYDKWHVISDNARPQLEISDNNIVIGKNLNMKILKACHAVAVVKKIKHDEIKYNGIMLNRQVLAMLYHEHDSSYSFIIKWSNPDSINLYHLVQLQKPDAIVGTPVIIPTIDPNIIRSGSDRKQNAKHTTSREHKAHLVWRHWLWPWPKTKTCYSGKEFRSSERSHARMVRAISAINKKKDITPSCRSYAKSPLIASVFKALPWE